jgi:hypothetical protein
MNWDAIAAVGQAISALALVILMSRPLRLASRSRKQLHCAHRRNNSRM